MEVGSVATPFEHRSFGEEMALCQRYFTKFGGASTYDMVAFGGTASSATNAQVGVVFPTQMRAIPSLTHNDLQVADTVNSAITVTSTAIGSTVHNNKTAWFDCNTSGSLTALRPYYVRVGNNANGHVSFDSEL